MNHYSALIAGKDWTGGEALAVLDPSTGKSFATTPDCGPDAVGEAVAAAKAASASWKKRAVAERSAILRRVGVLILRDVKALSETEARQTGKPLRQAVRDTEITARYFDFYASVIEAFHGEVIPLDNNTHIYTRWEPHGVTAHIIPWNYPMSIMARSVAPSLAMGNGCVVKPAEEAPLTSLMLAKIAIEAGLPAGLLNVVTGSGETAGSALTSHPDIGHISFTGSVEVGKLIAQAAARRVIPVTLELGGKSPNIVFADADLDRALPIITNSILQNVGQTCSAGARLLVQESIHDIVVERLAERFAAMKLGPALTNPDMGPLISGPQRQKVQDFVDAAKGEATLVLGGSALSGEDFGDGFFFQPTILDNVAPDSLLARDEVFGPVLAVTSFKAQEDAVALANGTDYGLVAGVWTTNVSTAHRMVQEIVAGQVFVNSYGASGGVEIPFGGFKYSGYGREKGVEGLKGFGQVKTAVLGL